MFSSFALQIVILKHIFSCGNDRLTSSSEKNIIFHLTTDIENPGIDFNNLRIDGTVKWPRSRDSGSQDWKELLVATGSSLLTCYHYESKKSETRMFFKSKLSICDYWCACALQALLLWFVWWQASQCCCIQALQNSISSTPRQVTLIVLCQTQCTLLFKLPQSYVLLSEFGR